MTLTQFISRYEKSRGNNDIDVMIFEILVRLLLPAFRIMNEMKIIFRAHLFIVYKHRRKSRLIFFDNLSVYIITIAMMTLRK